MAYLQPTQLIQIVQYRGKHGIESLFRLEREYFHNYCIVFTRKNTEEYSLSRYGGVKLIQYKEDQKCLLKKH